MRPLKLISSSAAMVALCTLLAGGCGGSPQTGDEQAPTDPQSGGLNSAPGSAEGEEGNGNGGGIARDPSKVTICHIPPGNPANAHSITVGLPAVKAHLKHGDTLGACGSDGGTGEVDAGTGEVDAGTGETDAGTGGTDAGTGEVDAGTGSECAPVGSTCGGGVVCCDGLTCSSEGYCEPIIG
ncbi:hypothetical protein [Myxococcus sp. RHSTA-1-4]|uniref:hypothetical protein n=1 Tax=Myxococcus sp. RHSTA-1-4 TaxID=2874601 RepID=UPI001CC0E495|nr:hypothetical protein [Myxococcus sp. RHSTA-1-4]MBZ4418682.1 hypothetical protein [Myxococcus sp. RHSTA-1-4]